MSSTALSIKCNLCHKSIKPQQSSVLALRATWHRHCFRCSVCKGLLDNLYYSRKKKLYCREHFLSKFSNSCQICQKKITGLIMVSGDVSFHPECFRCFKCHKVICDADGYSFEERSELYCEQCYGRDVKGYTNSKSFKLFQKRSIHQVSVNPLQIKKTKFASKILSKDKSSDVKEQQKRRNSIVSIISNEDETLELKNGDTVLEINGIPVTGENIDKLTKTFLEDTDHSRRISVTVERSPIKVTSPNPEAKENLTAPTPTFTPKTPASADPELYKRNVTYFNFSVEQSRCNSDTTTEMKRHLAIRKKTPKKENSLDSLPENEKLFIAPKKQPLMPPKKLGRSNSLTELDDISTSSIPSHKDNLLKLESSLHRAQSVKVDTINVNQSRLFRPVDLVFGEVIGKGFFGDVYKVKDRVTGDEMVVKKLRDIDNEAEEQFLKEVHVLKALKHPHVLKFIGVMYKDRILHVVVEYISGGTLRALLKHKFIEISWKQKIEISRDIASGMKYLHSNDVMHRDLKSKNVLIKSKDGRHFAIVADFGLATVMLERREFYKKKSIGDEDENLLSPKPISKKRHTMVGSPYWMAPEMLFSKGYNETTDIFSYGIVMCEIISRLKADPEILPRTSKFGLDVENFKKLIGDCPQHFLDLAVGCCSLDPTERPSFLCIEKWLQLFLTNIEVKIELPKKMTFTEEPNPIRLMQKC